MSYIFDALQRSERERGGAKATVVETATELLERAERRALMEHDAEGASREPRIPGLDEVQWESCPAANWTEALAVKASSSREESDGSNYTAVLQDCEALVAAPSEGSHLVCLTDKDTPAAEAFRLLVVRLRRLRKERPLKKLLLTSTAPQEGKSFAAANLACALASARNEKVLLLEADLRRPSLRRLFGVRADSGICEYVRGESDLTSSLYRLNTPGIWLLPSGSAEGDPLEIIQSPKMSSLVSNLSGLFDWFIIDTPPMLPLADTTALARLADGILLVTRRDITKKGKLKKGLEAFAQDKLIGAILNFSDSANDIDYYYYRHHPKLLDKRA